jgi:alpha-L-rhamnosidase
MPLFAHDLRCEYRTASVGIDNPRPRLSWILSSDVRGQRQSAYQVLVSSSADWLAADQGDLWDSGKRLSDESVQIAYAGKALASRQACFWKVRVWDEQGQPTAWSEPATWTMGLLDQADWHGAKWIAALAQEQPADAKMPILPIFRKEFSLAKPLKRAIIFICGLGEFELRMNGAKVGDDYLQPGWTNYRKTCLYVPYDVTARVKPGGNAIGVMLGNGMYNVVSGGRYVKFKGSFGPPKLIAQLFIEYADGSSEIIVTDPTWRSASGPITFSSVYGGEEYDARREQKGWDRAGFDDSSWKPSIEVEGPGGELVGSIRSAPAVRVDKTLDPLAITQPKPGVVVCDLGQNCSIVPTLTLKGSAGARVRLIPAELLHADGTVSQQSTNEFRGGGSYCDYILKGGDEPETWSPRFYYHGSRYIQVEGAVTPSPGTPGEGRGEGSSATTKVAPASTEPSPNPLPVVVALQGKFITSSSPVAGTFTCSNQLLNRTETLIRWAIRSNMMSIFTDCPHREKLGWLEQIHLMGPSFRYSFDVALLLAKMCGDMSDAQLENGLVPNIAPEYVAFKDRMFRDSPEWGSAAVLVPWELYEWYGDTTILREQYETMRRYVAYLAQQTKNHIVEGYGLGDWFDLGPNRPWTSQLTPLSLTATAFYHRDLMILSQTARLLGKSDDAVASSKLADDVKAAFNKTFYDGGTHQYATGSQCANAIPLVFSIAPEDDRAAIVENIVTDVRNHNNGLTAGDVGYRYVLRALADGGRSDVIFDMNSRSDRPGYGYMLEKGATSLTEAWDARPETSQNHFMLGHILEWLYSDVAGIQRDPSATGFKKIIIKPAMVGDLTWASASYDSVRGRITSSWRRKGNRVTMDVTIPVGATAVVHIPATSADLVKESAKPARDAQGVKLLRMDDSRAVFEVESGSYQFST